MLRFPCGKFGFRVIVSMRIFFRSFGNLPWPIAVSTVETLIFHLGKIFRAEFRFFFSFSVCFLVVAKTETLNLFVNGRNYAPHLDAHF